MPTTISKITTAETQQFIDSEPQSFESITDEDIAAYKEHHKVLFARLSRIENFRERAQIFYDLAELRACCEYSYAKAFPEDTANRSARAIANYTAVISNAVKAGITDTDDDFDNFVVAPLAQLLFLEKNDPSAFENKCIQEESRVLYKKFKAEYEQYVNPPSLFSMCASGFWSAVKPKSLVSAAMATAAVAISAYAEGNIDPVLSLAWWVISNRAGDEAQEILERCRNRF